MLVYMKGLYAETRIKICPGSYNNNTYLYIRTLVYRYCKYPSPVLSIISYKLYISHGYAKIVYVACLQNN